MPGPAGGGCSPRPSAGPRAAAPSHPANGGNTHHTVRRKGAPRHTSRSSRAASGRRGQLPRARTHGRGARTQLPYMVGAMAIRTGRALCGGTLPPRIVFRRVESSTRHLYLVRPGQGREGYTPLGPHRDAAGVSIIASSGVCARCPFAVGVRVGARTPAHARRAVSHMRTARGRGRRAAWPQQRWPAAARRRRWRRRRRDSTPQSRRRRRRRWRRP